MSSLQQSITRIYQSFCSSIALTPCSILQVATLFLKPEQAANVQSLNNSILLLGDTSVSLTRPTKIAYLKTIANSVDVIQEAIDAIRRMQVFLPQGLEDHLYIHEKAMQNATSADHHDTLEDLIKNVRNLAGNKALLLEALEEIRDNFAHQVVPHLRHQTGR